MLSAMLALLLLPLIQASAAEATTASPSFSDLTVYDGAWTITSPHTLAGPGKPDTLVNHCNKNTAFYSCEQVVNGKPSALIVFVPAVAPLTYYSQPILPDGHATGRGDLTISGDHWTFLGKDVEGDKTTWYRTENYFTGRDKIHFEQFESTDNKTWKLTNSGDEVRQATPPH
jgi:hypothetical protein